MAKFLGNAFSIGMLDVNDLCTLSLKKISTDVITSDVISVVGHLDTANVLSNLLGFEIEMNRQNLKLDEGDILYVAQLKGGRLPEGATTLPEGWSFEFYEVRIESQI